MSAERPPVLCDLDGVVWLSHQPIPGSVEAIARLRAAGHRVLFVTNNSFSTLAEHEAALAGIGIPAVGDVLSSAMAAAKLMHPGERALVCAGDGVREALEARGVECRTVGRDDDGGPVDAVVVGLHRWFDYAGLMRANAAIRAGARLIGANHDPSYPTPEGVIPGGGAILAAIETASERRGVVAGKPHRPMADMVRAVIGDAAVATAVMVGDRPDTDGAFARQLGCRYVHVRTGVTVDEAAMEPEPDLIADDLAEFADRLLHGAVPWSFTGS